MPGYRSWTMLAAREVAIYFASLTLLAIVALASTGAVNHLCLMIVVTAVLATAWARWLFPDHAFFSVTFVNLTAVYAAIFSFFMDEIFGRIGPVVSGIGFAMPIIFFIAGCWIWRSEIERVVGHPHLRDGPALMEALLWVLPMSSVGAGVILLSLLDDSAVNTEVTFLGAMMLIATIALAVSRNIATFLVDTALLFEEFFARMSRLAIPAFAFLTFYALLVIVFASLYVILSRYSLESHFRVAAHNRAITFPEAIHFSVVTISTVGYGDIVPVSSVARVLASVEVMCGVLLLLFGVSELLEYTREHRHDRKHRKDP